MSQIQRPRNLKTRCVSKLSATLQHWVLITALAPALTSCMGVYDGGFECPPGEGVGCKSISEVNQMVNEGELPKKENDFHTKPCEQYNSPVDLEQKNSGESLIWYSPQVWEEA